MSLITLPTIDFPNIASDTPLWLALLTTFIAAMSGALRGRDPGRVRYDIVGIVVFAFFLGVGGGVTRDLLLEEVWGYAAVVGTRTVDVHIAQVRAKLGDASPVRTVRGVGYSAEAP